ncbi:MAG: M48 family metallopeptidase [Pseudomonadota bacterium]
MSEQTPISGIRAPARYFDGQTAYPKEAEVAFGERSLVIFGAFQEPIDHWPLGSLRTIPGGSGEAIQLTPHEGSEARLILADERMIRALRLVCPDLNKRKRNRGALGKAMIWAAGALGSVALIVFVLVPALSVQLAEAIPLEQEQSLGDAVAKQLTALMTLTGEGRPVFCGAPDGAAALAKMTDRLTGKLESPYPLRVEVLDHPLVNAVALPGGRVILFRGLIENANAPEEVAGVLAHEIGHVINRDPMREALRAAGTAGILGLLLGDVVGGTAILAASEAVMNAQYRQDAEEKADRFATKLLADAGLPSTPLASFFRSMIERHGDVKGFMKYISSHPQLAERARKAEAEDIIGARRFEPVLSDRGWVSLREICAGAEGHRDAR